MNLAPVLTFAVVSQPQGTIKSYSMSISKYLFVSERIMVLLCYQQHLLDTGDTIPSLCSDDKAKESFLSSKSI